MCSSDDKSNWLVTWTKFVVMFIEKWCHFVEADSFSRPAGGSSSGSDEPQASGWIHKFTVTAYKPYFDVDTADVLDRLKESLYPFRGTFTEKTATNPDLWVFSQWLVCI